MVTALHPKCNALASADHQELFDRWLRGSWLATERPDDTFLSWDVAVIHAVGGTIVRGRSDPVPQRTTCLIRASISYGASIDEIRYLCTSALRMRACVAVSGPDPRKLASSVSDSHRS